MQSREEIYIEKENVFLFIHWQHHSWAFFPRQEKTRSTVLNFSLMDIFPIPFFTFVSCDGIHSGFTIPFFKIEYFFEYVFIMRCDWFYHVSQVLCHVLNHRAVIHPRVMLATPVSPFSTYTKFFMFFFFFFPFFRHSSSLPIVSLIC